MTNSLVSALGLSFSVVLAVSPAVVPQPANASTATITAANSNSTLFFLSIVTLLLKLIIIFNAWL
ncbi:MAG: hypothetical protein ACOY4Q_06045 [Bacillota bacterium]